MCFISTFDLERHGFVAGERVDITSVWSDGERTVSGFELVEYDIPAGCLASYFPETNPLVPLGSFAERARTPASKSIPVRLSRTTELELRHGNPAPSNLPHGDGGPRPALAADVS